MDLRSTDIRSRNAGRIDRDAMGIRFSPFFVIQYGRAVRYDQRKRSVRHSRCSPPGLALLTDPSKPGLIQTRMGCSTPIRLPGDDSVSQFRTRPGADRDEPAGR